MPHSTNENPYLKQELDAYMLAHEASYLEELCAFLRIPSISSLSDHQADMNRAAHWLAQAMRDSGLEHVSVNSTSGHPIVYGDWLHAPDQPTVLVYGHYDVQPAEPLERWDSPPFDPQIRDDKLFARGATDDKGQLYIHIKAVSSCLRKLGRLPINIKFCIEGEEEIGSMHLPRYIAEHHEQLRADVIVVSDTSLYSETQPALMYSLRGLACLELQVTSANSDLHSGMYGGGVPNSIHALAQLLQTFHDDQGRVNVRGFYDQVLAPSTKEQASFEQLSGNEEAVRQQLDLLDFYGEPGYSFYERTTARPTVEITSITGGFQGEGIKSIIPAVASAKIACRLVAGQEPTHILDLIEAHIAHYQPHVVKVNVTRLPSAKPFYTSPDHPSLDAACQAYEEVYGVKPVYLRGGGSIPIIELMQSTWQAPVVMMGFGLSSENLHAPNEHFHLANWRKGLQTVTRFWANLQK